jgi:hypothetical protein
MKEKNKKEALRAIYWALWGTFCAPFRLSGWWNRETFWNIFWDKIKQRTRR